MNKLLVFHEDAEPENDKTFRTIDEMIRWFKDDRDYNFPEDDEDRWVLKKLDKGEDAVLYAYSFRWVDAN